jgi:transcriptional activator SPT8
MDEEDQYSNSSAESERENDHDNDEVMEDADDGDNDNEAEGDDDNNDEEDEEDADNDDNDAHDDNENETDRDRAAGPGGGAAADKIASANGDGASRAIKMEDDDDRDAGADDREHAKDVDADGDGDGDGDEDDDADDKDEKREQSKSATSKASTPSSRRPVVRPEALKARLYDIVPTMAAPQATSVNAMAITPDLRYWFTGGSDGYIRKYDGPGTINGKLALTVAQRHPFVDSVTKAGILMSYWENEEPAPPGRGDQEHVLSTVYSLAVHSDALWLLSGLESGCIKLQSVRHDEGKMITCLQRHTNAVSVLTLAQDEKSVLSGGWDKNIFDWDLNTGQPKRSFDGTGGQISAIELRPANGDPVPADADEPLIMSSTISTNNGAPMTNGHAANGGFGVDDVGELGRTTSFGGEGGEAGGQASPAHESLFGGSDAGSLFGDTAGEQPFGHDEDEYNGSMGMMQGHEHEGGMDHSGDMAMASMEIGKDGADKDAGAATASSVTASGGDAMDVDTTTAAAAQAPAEARGATEEPLSQTESSQAALQLQQEIKREDAEDTQPLTQNGAFSASLSSLPDGQGGAVGGGTQTSPLLLKSPPPASQFDPSQTSTTTFLAAAMDGTIRLWDRRVPNPVARIGNRVGVPPWCMSACWSPNGNMIYAGRRNGTVEEFDVRKAKRGWEPERVLKFPAGSGAVSAVKPMVNGRHLVWYVVYDFRLTVRE